MSIPSTLISCFIGLASCGSMGSRIVNSLWLIEVDPHGGGSISLRPNTSASPLPASLSDALIALEQDEVMRHALGEEFIKVFTVVKRHEIDKWNNHVSDW